MESQPIQTVSIRIPADLYAALKAVAAKENISFNKLTEQALRKRSQDAEREALREAINQIADSSEEIELHLAAQSEVALGDPE